VLFLKKLPNTVGVLLHNLRLFLPKEYTIDALSQALQLTVPLGNGNGWTASEDLLWELFREVRENRPTHVLELGSGYSTLVMAASMRKVGLSGKITSLDHHAKYLEQTRSLLCANGLDSYVDLRLAPLKEVTLDGYSGPWYDELALQFDKPIDMVLVDGPPAILHPHIRFPTLPMIWKSCRKGCRIFLHDAHRKAEKRIVETWVRTQDFRIESFDTTKGLAILTKE